MVISNNRPVARTLSWRIFLQRIVRQENIIGWLFVLPALLMYATFVLLPLLLSIQYSFFRWDGIGPMTWAGLDNYATVL
jgi:raffinose/stachyose/melibiose transport system permease protein